MENGIEKPFGREEAREQRSFNPVASIEAARDDLRIFGEVTSQTWERIYDIEMSLLVEGMDRAACTTFVLKREGDDLAYYKNGKWESYTAMLLTGREVAELEAAVDSRKQFLFDDSVTDLMHGYKMRALKSGEQHVWASPYRYDIQDAYDTEFMRSCGRFPDRKMGFLYRASCNADGNIVLESQTVDHSDNEAFAATLDRADDEPGVEMDSLVDTYDSVLSAKYEQDFYAGRTQAERNENAWTQLEAQRDLIAYFMNGIENLARSSLYGYALEEATKQHTYGVWAAFKKRLDGGDVVKLTPVSDTLPIVHLAMMSDVTNEVRHAFDQFVDEGRVMVGCGGEIKMLRGKSDILSASIEDVLHALFGEKPKKTEEPSDKYGSLVFSCPKGHQNTRPHNRLLSHCQHCGVDVGCGEVSVDHDDNGAFAQAVEKLLERVFADQKELVAAR